MVRGGSRPGAGRPVGTGKFGEPTVPLRVPQSMARQIRKQIEQGGAGCPLYACKVAAGFPSPADDYIEGRLDLNEHLVRNPAATFFVRATGESMLGAGIFPDDLLIVDRSVTPAEGDVVIAALNGELTVKRLGRQKGRTVLLPENPQFRPIEIGEGEELSLWGVVRFVIHAL